MIWDVSEKQHYAHVLYLRTNAKSKRGMKNVNLPRLSHEEEQKEGVQRRATRITTSMVKLLYEGRPTTETGWRGGSQGET